MTQGKGLLADHDYDGDASPGCFGREHGIPTSFYVWDDISGRYWRCVTLGSWPEVTLNRVAMLDNPRTVGTIELYTELNV